MENNRKAPNDENLKKTFDDLQNRKTDLLNVIDQIENKGRENNFFSDVEHYKEELATVNTLIKTIQSLINK